MVQGMQEYDCHARYGSNLMASKRGFASFEVIIQVNHKGGKAHLILIPHVAPILMSLEFFAWFVPVEPKQLI